MADGSGLQVAATGSIVNDAVHRIGHNYTDGAARNIVVAGTMFANQGGEIAEIFLLEIAFRVPKCFCIRNLIQQHPMQTWMNAVNGYDVIHKLTNQQEQGTIAFGGTLQDGSAILEMPLADGSHQGMLVWKILIVGADTDAGSLGNLVGGKTGPAFPT